MYFKAAVLASSMLTLFACGGLEMPDDGTQMPEINADMDQEDTLTFEAAQQIEPYAEFEKYSTVMENHPSLDFETEQNEEAPSYKAGYTWQKLSNGIIPGYCGGAGVSPFPGIGVPCSIYGARSWSYYNWWGHNVCTYVLLVCR